MGVLVAIVLRSRSDVFRERVGLGMYRFASDVIV
jgi:hypothetical protein